MIKTTKEAIEKFKKMTTTKKAAVVVGAVGILAVLGAVAYRHIEKGKKK